MKEARCRKTNTTSHLHVESRILKLIESGRTRIDAGGWGRENGELVFNRIRGSVGR